jgi:hypothetical protein
MVSERLKRVDHSALRVNQVCIIALLIVAYVLDAAWLVAIVTTVMLIGTAVRQPGFKMVYSKFLQPRGLVKSDVILDNPQPHVFAQGMGGTVLLLALTAFVLGSGIIGWALSWLVVALAALNLFVGFCAGCFVYYILARIRVPGFGVQAIAGTFPGMRPNGRTN